MTDDETHDEMVAHYRAHLQECGVAPHLHEGLLRYLVDGVMPGDFLCAALSNLLTDSYEKADEESLAGMHGLVLFLYNHVPMPARRSREAITRWCEKGGHTGLHKSLQAKLRAQP